MRSEEPRIVRLQDYRPPDHLVDHVRLDIVLHPEATQVSAELELRPNPAGRPNAPLVLDGDGLVLAGDAVLDGAALDASAYEATPAGFVLHAPPQGPFRLALRTVVNPTANTQLMGLYRSNRTYCTQCEADGFRRITYMLDRPDVLALYTVRVEADRGEAPVLLSNGNRVDGGALPDAGRHFAVWHDPFPKPSYLFALVGGDLASVEDRFTTMTGRSVGLGIYVERGKEQRARYAMDALKRAMRWDETAFGRAYDLDVFNIVAVSDFNMGAMENKGLNVFNDKYVLASPETATDADYAGIEAVIAHEYLHNWTGNRITCRDWFQLCLKEGLTVFRDQEFSSDQRSRPVKRIVDVRNLRAQQFPEDSGPFAHPVRPDKYREINNLYTATVYEKGAELIRMLKALIGADAFRRGMDLYFERHDGHAATVEDFIACFAEASGRDLGQFLLWYAQAGTPAVAVAGTFDAAARSYTLDVVQTVPATPDQPDKAPVLMPLAIGLLDPAGADQPLRLADGTELRDGVLVLSAHEHRFLFQNIGARPIPSINRGFSAPVKITADLSDDDLLFLARHDRDPFARWQALQNVATRLLVRGVAAIRAGETPRDEPKLTAALEAALDDGASDPAFVAQLLTLPSESDIARELGADVDPDAVHAARRRCRARLAAQLGDRLVRTYDRLSEPRPYVPDAEGAGRRSLRAAALDILVSTATPEAIERARRQYATADNMTDRMAGLAALAQTAGPAREAALADFYRRFAGDALVLDKWLALQATIPEHETLDRVRTLMRHEAFSLANPNRVRALIGAFSAANPTQFNRADGAGYDFIAETVLTLDPRNPQLAARLLGAFRSWKVLEPERRGRAEAALRRIAAVDRLSADVADLVGRALA